MSSITSPAPELKVTCRMCLEELHSDVRIEFSVGYASNQRLC